MARLFLIPVLVLSYSICEADENKWFVSLYGGQYSDTALNEIIRFSTDFKDSHVYVLSVGKELGIYKDTIGYELEGQLAVHSGQQDHYEVNVSYTLRWLPFIWDSYLDTSFAFGNGLSYASEDPELEAIENDENRTNSLLYYILVELAVHLPSAPEWELFTRIHHRSSVFGLIGGIFAGSNYVGCGVRYKF